MSFTSEQREVFWLMVFTTSVTLSFYQHFRGEEEPENLRTAISSKMSSVSSSPLTSLRDRFLIWPLTSLVAGGLRNVGAPSIVLNSGFVSPPFSNSWAEIFRTGVPDPDPELLAFEPEPELEPGPAGVAAAAGAATQF